MKVLKPVIFLTFANDKVDDALYLRNLPLELHGIRDALDKAVKAGLCEVVERTSATIEDVFNVFQDPYYKDRIAIFHYGGHANGNQLMLETLDGGHGATNSEGLVPFLSKQKGLQLVFLNGCASQQQTLEMSEAGIPAVIGTATAIKDEAATDLATRFYNGLASGATLNKAWLEAIDILKTKTDTQQRKGLKLRRDTNDDFPWNLTIRSGAEIVNEWNLPSAVNNPLFGLPDLPKLDLPQEPFLFLRRYDPEHAAIFFGRDTYIRQLYDRITSDKSAPVILFYGQSGAGKSSTLASGLLPRLSREADVKYVRREVTLGLLGTLDKALGGQFKSELITNSDGSTLLVSEIRHQIDQLENLKSTLNEAEQKKIQDTIDILQGKLSKENVDIDVNKMVTRLERWLAIEAETGRPFHILLDQVEETFTRLNTAFGNELEALLHEIHNIFIDPNHRPKGKIILSYRKEYNPEIEEACKKLKIPRETIFLKKLERGDILSVVTGITSTENLRQKYQIHVEEELSILIADDIGEDTESPIAPVLSILLTKLWQLAKQQNESKLSVQQYQVLKKGGILMEDFFKQQMQKLKEWSPELEKTGLALDVLNFHTTQLGTSDSQAIETIRQRYQHQDEQIHDLLDKFKQLYLLSDSEQTQTSLAHDTLAPIVKKQIRESDKVGQRAYRILSSKAAEFAEDERLMLDNTDLSIVEEGKNGMRLWTPVEEKLVAASRKVRARQRIIRRNLIGLGVIAVVAIIGLSAWAYIQKLKSDSNFLVSESILAFSNKNYSSSLYSAKEALDINSKSLSAHMMLLKNNYAHIYKMNDHFYKTPFTIGEFSDLGNVQFADTKDIVAGISIDENYDYSIVAKDMSGNTIAKLRLLAEESIIRFVLSSDGKYIGATGIVVKDSLLTSHLWSIEDSKLIHRATKKIPSYEVNQCKNQYYEEVGAAILFSPNNNYYVYSYESEQNDFTKVINLSTKKVISLPGRLKLYEDRPIMTAGSKSNIFSKDEKLILMGNKAFDLSQNGKLFRNFKTKNLYTLDSYFIKNGTQAVLVGDMYLEIFSLESGQQLQQIEVQQSGAGLEYYTTLDSTGQYLIYNNALYGNKESNGTEVLDFLTNKTIFNTDGLPIKIIQTQDGNKLIVTHTGNTTLYNLPDVSNQSADVKESISSSKYTGEFVSISPDGLYIITETDNEFISVWDLTTTSNKPLVILRGEFSDISEDGRLISTSTGVYDLFSNPYVIGMTEEVETYGYGGDNNNGFSFSNLDYFHSEDGQYLIQDDGKTFNMYYSLTGKPVKMNAKDKELYQKQVWQPYKKAFYEEMADEIDPNDMPIIVSNDGVFEIFGVNGFLRLYKTGFSELLAELPMIGKEVFTYHFIANGSAIEVISSTKPYPTANPTFYSQIFWLDKEVLLEL